MASKESFSTIDSALQSGLRDPRERVASLRLKKAVLDFMIADPHVRWMEVGGPANSLVLLPHKNPPVPSLSSSSERPIDQSSFHRLLVHRPSDRFGIVREKGLVLENSLRLIKVPESKIPEALLQDLDPAEYASAPADYAGSGGALAVPPSPKMANKASPILA